MDIDAQDTALVLTDPQNDFLSPDGVTWELVGASVEENGTVEHIEQLLKAAKDGGYEVFVSPHYYYPTDREWRFGGALELKMHEIGMFERSGPLDLDGFRGSGADWLERYKPYLDDGRTVIVGPHKVYGPQNNDLALQLRKRGIGKVVLAGMSANLCIESHLRDLLENGFEVVVVSDATAAAQHPEMGDGYAAALTNFRSSPAGCCPPTRRLPRWVRASAPAPEAQRPRNGVPAMRARTDGRPGHSARSPGRLDDAVQRGPVLGPAAAVDPANLPPASTRTSPPSCSVSSCARSGRRPHVRRRA